MFRRAAALLIEGRKSVSLRNMRRCKTFQRFSRKLSQVGWPALILTFSMAQGTGDLIVVSETGEPFRLYLNGEWILDQPGTRAEAHDLHEGFHKGTIYLYPSEGKAVQLRKTFTVEGGYVEYYAIRKNRKGQYIVTVYNRALKEEPAPLPPPLPGGPPSSLPSPSTQSPSSSQPASNSGQVQTNTQNQTIIFNPTIQIQTGGGGTQISGQSTGTGTPTTPQGPIYTGPTYTGPCNCQQPMSRSATKYPLFITRFLKERGWVADVVELSGNIELAAPIGLAEAVVDVVQTGATLKAAGLVEVLAQSTARLIVNR